MTFAVKVIRRLGTWQYLIFHIVFMLNFIIIIMVWVEVPLLVVGVWRIVCSTVEGFMSGIVACYGCHWSVNQRFLIWLLLCF